MVGLLRERAWGCVPDGSSFRQCCVPVQWLSAWAALENGTEPTPHRTSLNGSTALWVVATTTAESRVDFCVTPWSRCFRLQIDKEVVCPGTQISPHNDTPSLLPTQHPLPHPPHFPRRHTASKVLRPFSFLLPLVSQVTL